MTERRKKIKDYREGRVDIDLQFWCDQQGGCKGLGCIYNGVLCSHLQADVKRGLTAMPIKKGCKKRKLAKKRIEHKSHCRKE